MNQRKTPKKVKAIEKLNGKNMQINANSERERVNNAPLIFFVFKTVAILFCLGFLFFGITFNAEAATYYVDSTSGLDTNNGTTIDTPWQTIAKVNTAIDATTIKAGDTVYFKKGETFAGFLDVDTTGTAGNILTFGAYGTGANPIIDATGNARGIDIRAMNYVTFQNLTIINATTCGILFYNNLDNIIVDNITISATPYAIYVGAGVYSNITISNSTFSGTTNGLLGATGTSYSDLTISNSSFNGSTSGGFIVNNLSANPNSNIIITDSQFNENNTSNSGSNVLFGPTDYLTITNSEFSNNGSYGMELSSVTNVILSGLTITYNYLGGLYIINANDITLSDSNLNYNSQSGIGYNGLHLAGTGSNFTATNVTASNNGGDGFNIIGNWTNVVFDQCVAENNGTTGATTDGDGFSFHETSTGTIKNSVAKNNKKTAAAHVGTSAVDMYNNLFYSATNGTQALVLLYQTGVYTLYNNTIYSGTQTGTAVSLNGTVTMKNNIIFGADVGILLLGGSTTGDYNIVYGANTNYSGLSAGTHDVSVDPKFTTNGSDFSLQSTSPCIDAGVSLDSDYDDAVYPGSTWPSSVTTADQDLRGSGWEIGAYIYPVPQAPTIGTPTAQSSSAIRWNFTDNANDETGFKVYDSTDTLVASSSTANATYVEETELSENTQYSGRYIKAYNSYGNSTASSAASAIYTLAATPTNFIPTSNSSTIDLIVDSFTNDTTGSSGYYFSRSGGGNSGWIQTRLWQETGLSCDTSYTYSVKYRNADGTETNTVSATKSTTNCGGGGGLSMVAYNPPSIPPEGYKMTINQGSTTAKSRMVTLGFNANLDIKSMAISNSPDFVFAIQEPYQQTKQWDICGQNISCLAGEYTVYAKFYTQYGQSSEVVKANILYKPTSDIVNQQPQNQEQASSQKEATIAQLKQQLITLITQVIEMLYQQIALMKS